MNINKTPMGQQASARHSRADGLISNVVAPKKVTKIHISKDTFRYPSVRTAYTFIAICLLAFATCDLFNPVDPDILKKIDAEIAWANAAKLNVTIAFPPAWGTSTPGQGLIQRNIIDIRQGYDFEIEFTPVTEFNFLEWRAYATEDLTREKLGDDWQTSLDLLLPIQRLCSGVNLDSEVLIQRSRGGRGVFRINTTKNITLIPYCTIEAYIIRSEPRDNKQGSWPVMSPIILYFNSPLDPEMVWEFGSTEGMIDINYKDDNGNYTKSLNDRYETPIFQTRYGLHTVTINPKIGNPPDDDLEVELTIGPEIFNANDPGQDFPMTVEKIYWKTTRKDLPIGSIIDWGAEYNNNRITVTYKKDEDGAGDVTGKWREGWGSENELIDDVISGITSANSNDVRFGIAVSGVREYRIKLQLIAEGIIIDEKEIRIWNIPGMNVHKDNSVHLTQSNFIESFNAPDPDWENYILTSDIELENYTPIANFSGKFYGNGHTITINSFANGQTNLGLFGTVTDALIRDIRVEYGNINVSGAIENFGGVAGKAEGSTIIRNIIVNSKSNDDTEISSIANINAGMIAGSLQDNVTIENCYTVMDLNIKSSSGVDIRLGGIVGSISNITAEARVENTTASGNLTASNSNAEGIIFLGGVCGEAGGESDALRVIFRKVEYLAGNIENKETTGGGDRRIGGFIGRIDRYIDFVECGSQAKLIEHNSFNSEVFAGGFAGEIEYNSLAKFDKCFSTSPLYITFNNLNKRANIGGFLGVVIPVPITTPPDPPINTVFNDIRGCYASGSVSVTVTNSTATGDVYAGGFVGLSQMGANYYDCYALGNVVVDSYGSNNINVGGFVGRAPNSEIFFENCFSAGSVYGRTRRSVSGEQGAWLGGFVGYIWGHITMTNNRITNCVVLGSSIINRSPTNAQVHRILSRRIDDATRVNTSNNHAIGTMEIRHGPFDGSLTSVNFSGHTDVGPNLRHGATASTVNTIYNPGFWRVTLGWSDAWWDFGGLASHGYPLLRNVGGQNKTIFDIRKEYDELVVKLGLP